MKLLLFHVDQQVEDEADISPETEADTATLCLQGKHNFILDEDIAIKCKYCCHLDLEMRYCVSLFVSLDILFMLFSMFISILA